MVANVGDARSKRASADSQRGSSTLCSTVERNFVAKLCNSAQRTAKAKLQITWRQQRYAMQ
jgi:hypothetical protein